MSSFTVSMLIEVLVAGLLAATIFYCVTLNRRLTRLRSDEQALKATIAELVTATEIAERAIGGLKHTVRDVNENLGSQLAAATQMSMHLKNQLGECDGVFRRLSKIVNAGRPAAMLEPERDVPQVSSAKAVAAAAQAFSDRRRANGLAA